jgi:hypothetical protein
MNTGIQDALNLGWKLAFAASAPTRPVTDVLLDSYERERRPVARHVFALTHALFWGEAGTDPLARFARASLAPLASPMVPYLLRRRRLVAQGVRLLSQLRVHYRHSELSVEGEPPGRHGARPGERLPDALVEVVAGRCRLHELIAHPGVHVLLDRDAIAPPDQALGPLVSVHRMLDRRGAGVVVVRPDGYVGFRAAEVDPCQVVDWLSLISTPPRRRMAG